MLSVKLNPYSRCNISVKQGHIICHRDLLISLVENNQHHCWLVWLLISLLPDLSNRSLAGTEADALTLGEKGCLTELRSTRKRREYGKDSCCSLAGFTETHRVVNQWVSVVHELIAGTSNSQSTHWANWVPVSVWDIGEVIPSYQLWGVVDSLQSVAHQALGFRFCDEHMSFLSSYVLNSEAKQTQAATNWLKLQPSDATRKTVCAQMSEGFPSILFYPANKPGTSSIFTIHSAVHDIYCKQGLLQESSCSNTGFVCKITYSGFWRNDCVCVAAQHQFYRWLKALKGLLIMAIFTHFCV